MAGAVKVYGPAMSWNIARVLVSLEEAGVQYDVVPIDFAAAEHKSPAHLARNSRAIAKYVCRKYKPELLTPDNLEHSAMVDVWLEVEAHQFRPVAEAILMEVRIRLLFAQPIDDKVVDENVEKLRKVMEVYEAHLSKFRYLAGNFISLADLNHVSAMLCLMVTRSASVFDAYPRVKAWWMDLVARPAVKKVAAMMQSSVENGLQI